MLLDLSEALVIRINAILGAFLLLVVLWLLGIPDMRSHRGEQALIVLPSLLPLCVLVDVRVPSTFLDHTDLLLPNGLCGLLKLDV
jgi:hypothetical protein